MPTEPGLRPQHRKVMRALSELHYANYQQLARYGFSPRSYTHVSEATADLIEWGFVAYDFEKRGSPVGRAKRIATYTKRGRAYCAREMPEELLPFTTPHHDVYFQEHKRGVADLIIAARQFANANAGRVRVAWVQDDLVTRLNPLIVPGAKLVPDLFLVLNVDDTQRPYAFEYDRGTEKDTAGEKQWRTKIRKYVAALRGPIQERFTVNGCTIAVVIDPVRPELAQRRLQTLLTWTEKELTELFPNETTRHGWGNLIVFAVCAPAVCNPTGLFTAPWWVSPFARSPRALIEK